MEKFDKNFFCRMQYEMEIRRFVRYVIIARFENSLYKAFPHQQLFHIGISVCACFSSFSSFSLVENYSMLYFYWFLCSKIIWNS